MDFTFFAGSKHCSPEKTVWGSDSGLGKRVLLPKGASNTFLVVCMALRRLDKYHHKFFLQGLGRRTKEKLKFQKAPFHKNANPHFPEKRVSGSKKPPFPSPSRWKREFSVKKSPFFYKGRQGESVFPCREQGYLDTKLPFPARVRARGNGTFWAPKPSFPGNGDSGPVWGRECPKNSLETG